MHILGCESPIVKECVIDCFSFLPCSLLEIVLLRIEKLRRAGVRLEKEETEEVKPKELRLTGLESVITGLKDWGQTFSVRPSYWNC